MPLSCNLSLPNLKCFAAREFYLSKTCQLFLVNFGVGEFFLAPTTSRKRLGPERTWGKCTCSTSFLFEPVVILLHRAANCQPIETIVVCCHHEAGDCIFWSNQDWRADKPPVCRHHLDWQSSYWQCFWWSPCCGTECWRCFYDGK